MTTEATTRAATVAALYEAFGRGDIQPILDRLADDISFDADWTDNYAQRAGVRHLRPSRGKAEVAEFFALIGEWRVDRFEVLDVIGTGRQVVAEITSGFTLPNGGRFTDDELHLWTFNEAGKVSRFRHYIDTAKHIVAADGGDAT
jgi:ketosteroid isomerase-like protein